MEDQKRSLQFLFPHLGIPHLASGSVAVSGFKNCHHLFGGNHRKVMHDRCFKYDVLESSGLKKKLEMSHASGNAGQA